MLIEIALLVITLVLTVYWYITKDYDKWKKLGVPYLPGSFPYGSHKELFTQEKHMNTLVYEDYQLFKDKPFYGTFIFGKPMLHVNNIETARHILVKNFNNFVDRNDPGINKMMDGGESDQLWFKQLANLNGDEWKDLRSTFSPIFTSGKMRSMFKFMKLIAGRLSSELSSKCDIGKDFELKNVFGKFSLDTLATCAFGIDPNSFEEKDQDFVKVVARVFEMSGSDGLTRMTRLIPGVQCLHKKFGVNIIMPKETEFLTNVIMQAISHRKKTGHRENDLIDLMIDCIKEETKKDITDPNEADDSQYDTDMKFQHSVKGKSHFNEMTVVATSLIILIAGYDTTGMNLSYLAYELAKNQEAQSKLQEEIDEAFEKTDGDFPDYNTIQTLPYLDACIHETLRLHTPLGNLFRSCTESVKIPGYDHVIEKGDLITISSVGIHRDEKYYPNPETFNPDNFSKEARQSRSPYTFLAFGQGPRACIGMRFAMLEAKVALMSILKEYRFLPSCKNPDKLEIDPKYQLGSVKGGLWANIERRSNA